MRSRASGGIWGDSSAAPSAATMSSLRRRAICVTRARSIARSSTGGRASARTTAPASPGSTSSRSQASRSRTSARWKNAAAPDNRYGTARSSKATATAWPSPRTERTSTQTSSGATSSRAISRSTSAATACACARSDAQRQNATSPPASPCNAFSIRSGAGAATAWAAARIRSRERNEVSSRTTVAAGHSARKSWMFLVAAPRKRWIAWSSSAAAVTSPARREQAQQQPLREARVLELVDQHVPVSLRQPRSHVRVGSQQAEALQHEVADVERAGLLEQALVGAVEVGELALAGVLLGQRGRPGRIVGRRHELVLEPVDALDDRAQRRARVAAQVVVAQRQLVDPLQQHGQSVGGAYGRHERIQPGLVRLVAQQARTEAVEGGDRQFLVGAGEAVLEPLAQRVGGRGRVAEDEQRLRRRALGHEVRETLGQHGRLAAAGAAQHEQRPAGMLDGGTLVRAQAQLQHLRRIRPR